MALSDDFGKRLKELRLLKHLTQAQLAEACGLSVQYLGRVERGLSTPSFGVVEKFCKALETDPANLFLFLSSDGRSPCRSEADPSVSLEEDSALEFSNTFVTWTGVWRRNIESGFDYWTRSLYQLLGYSSSVREPSIEFLLGHVSEPERPALRDHLEKTLAGSGCHDFVFRIGRKDGRIRLVVAHAEHVAAVVGCPETVDISFMDVTEWLTLQARLLESRGQLQEHVTARTKTLDRTIADLEREVRWRAEAERRLRMADKVTSEATNALAFIDTSLVYAFANSPYAELVGREGRELEGTPVSGILGEDLFRTLVEPRLRRAMAGERVSFQEWFTNAGSAPKFLDVSYAPYVENGVVTGVVATVHDITEHQRDREALQEREERFRLMVENMPVMIHAHDEKGGYVFWNRECERVSGYSQDEMLRVEDPAGLLYPDEQDRQEFFRTNQALQRPFDDVELTLTTKKGEKRTIAWTNITPYCPVPGWAYWEVGRDVTKQREAEAALAAAKNEAETANRAKSDFLAIMSHEIRSPLNGIMGMLRLLRSTPLDEEQAEYLDTAMQTSESLVRLLGDILDISRVEAGKLEMRARPFSIRETVTLVEKLFRPHSERAGLELHVSVDGGIPEMVLGDDARLQQVLVNLVGNAIKFTVAGSVAIEAWPLPAPDGKRRVLFSVSDTGIGISKDSIQNIFEPFFQGKGDGAGRDAGVGLGLYICRRLVELMNGDIVVDSEVWSGTSVCFSALFEHPSETAVEERRSPAYGREGGRSASCRILLAEDDPVNSFAVARLLDKAGFSVTTVDNGRRALDALKRGSYDLVLMDVQMSIMNGIEATRAIRDGEAGDHCAAIPVYALTAAAMAGDKEKILAAGMDGYLSKPLDFEVLKSLVSRLVEKRGN